MSKRLQKTLFGFGLGLYALLLAAFLFGKASNMRTVNLVPFRTMLDYLVEGRPFAVGNLIGNVLLLLPLGVYLALWQSGRSVLALTMQSALISIAVEMMQYLLGVGAADIDDVLLNTLGALLGIMMYKLLNRVFGEKTRQVVCILALTTGVIFLLFMAAAHSGIWGLRIRIFQ